MSFLTKLIGRNIRIIRKQKKLTQEELAERSGLQYSFLAGVERGERNITVQTLEKIIEGLQVSPGVVFDATTHIKNEEDFTRQDNIKLILSYLESCDSKEVALFYRLLKDIHDTYQN